MTSMTVEPTSESPICRTPENRMAIRATAASTVGAVLETVDFAAYGAAAATVFPKLFFPSLAPGMAVLAAFATFGVGFFARPIGGLLFGALGDRFGRKNILLYTLILMGVATMLIGLLPTYQAIGFAAPVLLVLLRFVQGLALGGEATGAQILTVEHAPAARRGFYGSIINIGASISAALATGMFFLISSNLAPEQFEAWGWRIPFLLAVIMVPVGVYIRRRVSETPAFEKLHASGREDPAPVVEAFKRYPGPVLRLLVIWCAPSACYQVINVFSLSYLTNDLGLRYQSAFLALMGANLLATITLLVCGALSDRIGRKPILIVASLTMLAISSSYFTLLQTRDWTVIFLAMAVFASTIQAQNGVQPAFFAESFPTRVRYSGSAIAYSGATLVAGGPTPLVLAWLVQRSAGEVWVVPLFAALVVGLALVAILLSPETRKFDLDRVA